MHLKKVFVVFDTLFDIEDSFLNKGYKKLKEGVKNYKHFFEMHNDLDSYTLRGILK